MLGVLRDSPVASMRSDPSSHITLTDVYDPTGIARVPDDVYAHGRNVAQVQVRERAPYTAGAFDPFNLHKSSNWVPDCRLHALRAVVA